MVILTDEDRGHTIEIGAESVVTVRLDENPSTGYRWNIETAEGLEIVGDSFERTGDLIGAGGVRIFQFRVSKAGSHRLGIRKWRDWEGERSIVDRFNVIIVVT